MEEQDCLCVACWHPVPCNQLPYSSYNLGHMQEKRRKQETPFHSLLQRAIAEQNVKNCFENANLCSIFRYSALMWFFQMKEKKRKEEKRIEEILEEHEDSE